jgi:hypothetical protein
VSRGATLNTKWNTFWREKAKAVVTTRGYIGSDVRPFLRPFLFFSLFFGVERKRFFVVVVGEM